MAKAKPQTKTKSPAKALPAKKTRGTRYTAKQKAAILLFVDKHNAKNGRGGAAAASRKHGITQLTISKWMKETGSPAPKRKATSDFNKTISRLTEVHKEMATLQEKLDKLRKEYAELKGNI